MKRLEEGKIEGLMQRVCFSCCFVAHFCCFCLVCFFSYILAVINQPVNVFERDKLYVQIRVCVNMYGYILPQYHLEGERIKKQQFSFAHVLPKNLATILHYNVLKTTRLTVL